LTVRRPQLLQDAYRGFTRLGRNVRAHIQIQFVDQFGNPEAGIDGGGLFKEFITQVSRTAFDPKYDLFCETADKFLYPNPRALATGYFLLYLFFLSFVFSMLTLFVCHHHLQTSNTPSNIYVLSALL
jgi:ubiquitin-protein ligase E3 C